MDHAQSFDAWRARRRFRGTLILAGASAGLFLFLTGMLQLGEAFGATDAMHWRLVVGQIAAAVAVLLSVLDARRAQISLQRSLRP